MRPPLGTLLTESQGFVRLRRIALRYLLCEVPFVSLESVPRIQLVIARRIRDGGEVRDTEVNSGSFVAGLLSLDLVLADDVEFPFVSVPDCFHLTNVLDSNIWSGFNLAEYEI